MSINNLIDRSVRCAQCGTPGVGTCNCWARCPCGWIYEAGGRCPAPVHGAWDPWIAEAIDIYAGLVGAGELSEAACKRIFDSDLRGLFSMGYAPDEAISTVLSSRP